MRNYWWRWLTRPAFRHTFMYTQGPKNTAIIVNMSPGGMKIDHVDLDVLDDNGYDDIHQAIENIFEPTVVLPTYAMVSPEIPISRLAPFTCVEMVRSILGIDKQIYTPKGLYDYLVSHRLRKDLYTYTNRGKIPS